MDPEFPQTLEELNIVNKDLIVIDHVKKFVSVLFIPTIPNCSMCMIIGLCIRQQLVSALPPFYRIIVQIVPETHEDHIGVNKQLADKERVAAALENISLAAVVSKCIAGVDKDNVFEKNLSLLSN
jgi:hypothetical protein